MFWSGDEKEQIKREDKRDAEQHKQIMAGLRIETIRTKAQTRQSKRRVQQAVATKKLAQAKKELAKTQTQEVKASASATVAISQANKAEQIRQLAAQKANQKVIEAGAKGGALSIFSWVGKVFGS